MTMKCIEHTVKREVRSQGIRAKLAMKAAGCLVQINLLLK